MEWNSTSLTPTFPSPHPPGSLTIPDQFSHHLHQLQPTTTTAVSRKELPGGFYPSAIALSSGASRGGGGVSRVEQDEDDDRRPSTPRNSSPAILAQDFGDDNLLDDENHDDLLVFGYGCKIFRDDERAKWVEKQKHLIPWMGNSDLLIDRYDCRGALMDVSRYESGSGYDNSQEDHDESLDLNSSFEQEQLLEQELDEERYKELNEDVDYDEGAYDKAGDYKKLQTVMNGMLSESQQRSSDDVRNYAAFQYNYDEQSHDICIGPEPKREHDEDAPYVKPAGLYVPEEIILPTTMKVHAIIAKTAKFIASQGNQMEIILKTKQSSNPLFDFLNHGGNLNAYYKFIVHAIRSGIYRPTSSEQDDDPSTNAAGKTSISSEYSGSEEDSEHHGYLHPSLFRTSITSSALSSIDYTGMGSTSGKHNAYSMLVSKIKGTDSPDPVLQQQSTGAAPSDTYSMYGYKMPGQQVQSAQAQVPRPHKKLPSTSDQLIIEKMASYVIKNGANFEVLAKNKSDPRFGFLNPAHEYHWYYLNCKERFKAESTAVVASSDFVTYGSANNPTSSSKTSVNLNCSSIKRSAVAAELAELKRKNSVLLAKREGSKEKLGTGSGSVSGVIPTENVFSQVNLVSKDKDKPVIRFATSLSGTVVSTPSIVVPPVKSEVKVSLTPSQKSSPPVIKQDDRGPTSHIQEAPKRATRTTGEPDDDEEEGEIRDDDGGSDSDLYLLDDDPGGGNSSPASEDDEIKVRRRMERKRKAAIFLQRLKMSKPFGSSANLADCKPPSSLKPTQKPVAAPALITGSSLGDLLSRRLQTTVAAQERTSAQHPPEIVIIDSEDNGRERDGVLHDDSKSSSSSRHSSRSRSRSHTTSSRNPRKRRRRRSRSYSSSASLSSSTVSSYDSSSRSYSRKKSSKKKRKKKKRKSDKEKSSRSSHKSKRR